MKGISRKYRTMLLAAAALVFSCGNALAAGYTITNLGEGLVFADARRINNNGDVVGSAKFSGSTPSHAALWHNGVATDLGALAPNKESRASFISDSGLIVGASYGGIYSYENAAIFSVGSAPININNVMDYDAVISGAGGAATVGSDVYILGGARNYESNVRHAIRWTYDGANTAATAVDMHPAWALASSLTQINSSGQMVGSTNPTQINGRATIWDTDGSVRYLNTSDYRTGATDINDAGQVLVEFTNGVDRSIGIWDGTAGTAGLQRISNPQGWQKTSANNMNNHGQIVGSAVTVPGPSGSGEKHAFLWDNGAMIDLKTLLQGTGWDVTEGYDINDKGQILVGAIRSDGGLTSLLLTPDATPTPIPAALPLFASGLAALGFVRRRRG